YKLLRERVQILLFISDDKAIEDTTTDGAYYMFQIAGNAIASLRFATINLYRSLTMQKTISQDQQNFIEFLRRLAICLFYIQYSIFNIQQIFIFI
ncbi:unnamed protein product, partial [Rotaria magnacalcarata]